MVDRNKLAIADCLIHKILGVVSHQPRIGGPYLENNIIPVRDINFIFYHIKASDCIWPEGDEVDDYWSKVNASEKNREGGS